MRRNFNHGMGGGFTLLEVLVSMAVGMIILMAAAALLGQTGTGYERVGGGIGAEREARALMTQLTADLSTAVVREDLTELKAGEEVWRNDRLGFLSLQPADAQSRDGRIGDLCAVSYYVKDLVIEGKAVRCLMRGFRESGKTFEQMGEGGDVESLFKENDRDEPVAFNVVSFVARPVVRGAGGEWKDAGTDLPEALDVRLVIARREMAGRLRTAQEWSGQGNAGRALGMPEKVAEHEGLAVFGSIVRFGNHVR